MNNHNRLLIRLGVGIILTVTAGFAVTIPRLINYQGRLTTTSGNPVPDSVYRRLYHSFIPESDRTLWLQLPDSCRVSLTALIIT